MQPPDTDIYRSTYGKDQIHLVHLRAEGATF